MMGEGQEFETECGAEAGHETNAQIVFVLRLCRFGNTFRVMKTLTVRLPEDLIAQIEAESRRRRLSKSDVVRERLTETKRSRGNQSTLLDAVADVIGSVDQLPPDLSARKKKYLRSTGYGDKRSG
jgi:Arc/MetJ-type ribon-helix-helix transcriptional regulator